MYSNDIYGFILIGKVKFQPKLRNIKKLLQMQDIITATVDSKKSTMIIHGIIVDSIM
jgi:hypothetical protein